MADDQAKSGGPVPQKPENPFVKKESPAIPPVAEKADLKKEVSMADAAEKRDKFKEQVKVLEPEVVPINPFAIKNGVEKKPVTEKQIPAPEKELPKVVEKKKEVIDIDSKGVVSVPKIENIPQPEVEESFWTVLAHAGISKRTLFMVLGFFVFVIVAIVVLLTVDFSSEPKEEAVAPKTEVKGEEASQDFDSSYIVGLENKSAISTTSRLKPLGYYGDLSGILTVLVVGDVPSAEKVKFVAFIALLDDMQNIYTTDVYGLLDKSVDRRAALEEFIKTMDDVIKQGDNAYNQIQQEMNLISAQYEQITESRDQYETLFFEASQNLYGEEAYKNLTTFIDLEKQAVALKSQHSADKTLSDMFANSLNALRPRYEDVVANVDALIQGVHVYDIPDSEINAIIRLGQK